VSSSILSGNGLTWAFALWVVAAVEVVCPAISGGRRRLPDQ